MDGFGEKSYNNLIASVEKRKRDDTAETDLRTWNCQYRSCQCEADLQGNRTQPGEGYGSDRRRSGCD